MFRTTRKAAPAAADPAHGHLVGYDGALPVQDARSERTPKNVVGRCDHDDHD